MGALYKCRTAHRQLSLDRWLEEMKAEEGLAKGDVVQIKPDHDEAFGGCLMIVTEPKTFGAQGYVPIPGKDRGLAFYRCPWEAMEKIGQATWISR